jgi:LCP family protein required for cell wall assembly
MTELYSIGYVDPERWGGGRFPGADRLFAPEVRADVRKDLPELTLGRLATRLTAVRPRRARLDVRFLLDRNGHPVTAVANMAFAGVGLTEARSVRAPLSQDGRFVLRRIAGRWRIDSFQVHSAMPSVGSIARRVRRASLAPPVPSKDLLFVLVIGSDARPGQSVTATRSDSLHIVGVNPRRGMASVLGIPRDSYVAIPGHGTQKINSALVYGGPELTVRTVEQLTSIPIDAYVLTGFDGFTKIVNAVGGIRTTIPYPMSDRYSHAYFERGPERLNGREALAFARDRHDVPGGDVGRSRNQGRLIVSALREFRADLKRDPAALIPWALAGARYLHTDLTLGQMAELLLSVPTIDAAHVRNDVVPGSGGTAGGQSVIRLGAEAQAMFRDLRQDALLGG